MNAPPPAARAADKTRDKTRDGAAAWTIAPLSRNHRLMSLFAPFRVSAATGFALLFAACAAMLLTAHGFETFGGYAPCALCLKQREVYWAIGGALLAFAAIDRLVPNGLRRRAYFALAALGFLGGAVLAAYHAGAEWKFWPGPATCGGARAASAHADLLKALAGGVRAAPCDEAAWRLFGVSMAGYNALISIGLAKIALLLAVFSRPPGVTGPSKRSGPDRRPL